MCIYIHVCVCAFVCVCGTYASLLISLCRFFSCKKTILNHSYSHIGGILCCISNTGGIAGFQQKGGVSEGMGKLYANESFVVDNQFCYQHQIS